MNDRQQNLSRRRMVAGAGATGALAVAAAALTDHVKPAPEPVETAPSTSPGSAGYRETAHVLRYYQTTRV